MSTGSIELFLVIDVLKSTSTETHWRSQSVHFVVNQAGMGVIYVVNPASAKEKRLAVKRLKQCVFLRQKISTYNSFSCFVRMLVVTSVFVYLVLF